MTKLSQDQIFTENSPCDDKTVKKHFLKKLGTAGYKCTWCSISSWLGKPITLQLDHIDGDHRNNRLPNLRLLCPNCHSQTDTYAGKNIWQSIPVTDDMLIDAINKSASISAALRVVGLDVGRTEYFARIDKLIKDGLAKLNKTTYEHCFDESNL